VRPRRITRGNTIDQQLLIEIRDELRAGPLAHQIGKDIDVARRIIAEQDRLDHKLARVEGLCTLLLRATSNIDAHALTQDELDLLADIGALEAEPA
jgi:hypothetical protein